MAIVVEPRKPTFSTRFARVAVRAVFALGARQRKPPEPPGGVVEHAYGADPAERLELLAPKPGVPERTPVIYIHGGGWIAGRKESYTRFLSFLAEEGYPVFNLEYPLAPENPHPGILRSLLAAMDWIERAHPAHGAFHVMGDSAGGNLAMMMGLLAANPALIADVDPERGRGVAWVCRSVVSLYGVLDRLTWIEDGFPGAKNMLESYGGPAAFEASVPPELAITPLDLAFQQAPPCFVSVGSEDELRRSSTLMAERLASGPSKLLHKEYPGERHGFFNFGKSQHDAELREDILAFLAAAEA